MITPPRFVESSTSQFTNLKSQVLPALDVALKSWKYFTKKTYSTRNIETQMLLGIQYFVTSSSRRFTTHIWDIRETNLESCSIYQLSHFNCFNLYSQQTDTQRRIFPCCTYLELFKRSRISQQTFVPWHSFTLLCGQLHCFDYIIESNKLVFQ